MQKLKWICRFIDELSKIADRFHVPIAMMNLGFAHVQLPDMDTPLQINMDGKQAARGTYFAFVDVPSNVGPTPSAADELAASAVICSR
ncbi:hypothetical protein K4K49_004657 [Colletotrichum sp. SAR 10_70]|nr:hypothetical protein K4K50_011429 [Colletotrichum sp. SAR 10_71]KAI8170247.1 hypothetical protein K4K49_004657 [Colletotrichum sp. SAR 10_70]KAJ4999565.1 hypothetical protein K4K48_003965 [Colletotrichum sp. SAR 10_66]